MNPAKALAVNTKGLPILPDELYLEIISYYPVTPIPDSQCPNITEQNIRRQVLSALSQTSLNLRRFFLCYLWQRIEVCRPRNVSMKSRTLALELIRQLEIVTIRDPTLAKYVQIVNIEIGLYSQHSVVAELARCLSMFHNLHTVQLKIGGDSNIQRDVIAKSFKGYVYQNVRTVVVSYNARGFLRCCPQSRHVDCYELSLTFYSCAAFWNTVAIFCPRLEVARNGRIPLRLLPEIAKVFPELRDLTLSQNHLLYYGGPSDKFVVKEHVVSGVAALKRLQILTIVDELDPTRNFNDSPSQGCYKIAQRLLLDLQRTDKQDKVIVMKFRSGTKKTVVLRHREPSPVFN